MTFCASELLAGAASSDWPLRKAALWYWLPCFVIFVVQPVVQVIAGNRRGTTLFLPCTGHALTSRCFCCAASISRSFEPVTCQLDRLSRSCQGDPLGCAEGLLPPPAQMGLSAAERGDALGGESNGNPASLVWGLLARRLLGQLRVKMRSEGGRQLSTPTGHCAPMGNSRASHDMPTISHSAITACCPVEG